MVPKQTTRMKISSLLARENGKSIAVVYHDVRLPYKYKYIPYNNMKHLKVYSIIILDYEEWKGALLHSMYSKKKDRFDKCVEFFRYYGFDLDNIDRWSIDR
jgi:hypothetical protein